MLVPACGKNHGQRGYLPRSGWTSTASSSQRLGEVEHRLELLIDHLDQLRRPLGGLGIARDDRGDLLAHEAHAVGGEDEPVLHVQAEPVGEILAGDHTHHAGDLLGGGGVDALDERVGVRALDDLGVEQVRAECEVVHVIGRAGDLFQPVDAAGRTARRTLASSTHVAPPAFARACGYREHSVDDRLVARAPAEVARDRFLTSASEGCGFLRSSSVADSTMPGRAETALEGAVVEEGLLQRCQARRGSGLQRL